MAAVLCLSRPRFRVRVKRQNVWIPGVMAKIQEKDRSRWTAWRKMWGYIDWTDLAKRLFPCPVSGLWWKQRVSWWIYGRTSHCCREATLSGVVESQEARKAGKLEMFRVFNISADACYHICLLCFRVLVYKTSINAYNNINITSSRKNSVDGIVIEMWLPMSSFNKSSSLLESTLILRYAAP